MVRMIRRTLLVGGFFIVLFIGSSALLTFAQTTNASCSAPQWWCMSKSKCVTAASECDNGAGSTTTTTATASASGCPSGQMQCPAMGSSPAGCYATCPTASSSTGSTGGAGTTTAQCASGQMNCWDSVSQKNYCYTGTACPTTTTTTTGQTCSSGQWWCISKSKCVMTATECDGTGTSTTTSSQCSSGQMNCWDPVLQKNYCYSGTTCPMMCGADMTKINCTDASGKSYEMCASKSNPTCSAGTGSTAMTMTEEQMKAECLKTTTMQWCSGTASSKGYCSQSCGSVTVKPVPMPAPVIEETPQKRCEQQATKEPSKWRWCKYQTMNTSDASAKPGYDGWCADTTSQWYQPCDESECKSKQGWNWCKSTWTDSWSGKANTNYWCAKECPVNDEESCKSAGREWCPSTDNMIMTPASGTASKGWCARKEDPPCTKASCSEKKGAKWCMPKYGGAGWCSLNGTCPDDEVVVFQWPTNQGQCEKYLGNWCKDSSMSNSSSWCTMGTEKCMDSKDTKGKIWCWWEEKFADKWDDCAKSPQTQSDCTSQGKNWCEAIMNYTPMTGASVVPAGWCSKNICPKAGLNNCPDGKTLAKKLEDCPTKASSGQKCWDGTYADNGKCPPEPKICAVGLSKDSSTGECFKTCSSGKRIKEDELCSDIDKRPVGELTDKEKEILKKKADKATELQQYASFFRQVHSSKIASEIEKLLHKLADDQRYIISYWTDAKFEEIDKSIAALKVAKEAAGKRGSVSDETEFKIDIEKAAIDDIRNNLGLTNNEQRLTELLDATLPELEHEGIAVSDAVKGRLTDASKLIEQIKSSGTVQEVNTLGQSLAMTLKTINDKDRPYLKGLLGLKTMTDWYVAQIDDIDTMFNGDADAGIEGLKKQITDAGFTPTVSFDEITKRITEARTAVANAKAGKASADPLGFLKRNALQKLAQAQNEMDDISTLLEIGDFINSIAGQGGTLERYQAQLNVMKKDRTTLLNNKKLPARDRTAKARAMLAEINKLQGDINTVKRGITQLKTLDKRGVKVGIAKLVDQLNDLFDRREGVKPENSIEDELKKLESTFELPSFDIPALKGALLGTQGVAQLFGKPARTLVRL